MSSKDTSNSSDDALNTKNVNGPLLAVIIPLTIVGIIYIVLSILRFYQNSLPQRLQNFFNNNYRGMKKYFHVIIYFMVGILFYYSYESWGVADCVYYIVVTFSTVGYGDLVPTTDESRLFTIFFLWTGVVFVFSIVSDFASSVIEYADKRAKNIMFSKLQESKRTPKFFRLLIAVSPIIVLIFLFAAFFIHYKNLTPIEAIYYATVTTSSVGYGDFVDSDRNNRTFITFYILVAVGCLSIVISQVTTVMYEDAAEEKKIESSVTEIDYESLRDLDMGDGLEPSDAILNVLVQLKRIDERDIGQIRERLGLTKYEKRKLTQEDLKDIEIGDRHRLESVRKDLESRSRNASRISLAAPTSVINVASEAELRRSFLREQLALKDLRLEQQEQQIQQLKSLLQKYTIDIS